MSTPTPLQGPLKRRQTTLDRAPARVMDVIDKVIASYADEGVYFNRADLVSARRTHSLVLLRWETWWRIRQLSTPWRRPFTCPQIAIWFGVDNATVWYGVRRYGELYQGGPPTYPNRDMPRAPVATPMPATP